MKINIRKKKLDILKNYKNLTTSIICIIMFFVLISTNFNASMSIEPESNQSNNGSKNKNEIYESDLLPFNFNKAVIGYSSEDLLWDTAVGDLDNDGDHDIIAAFGFSWLGSILCFENDGTPWGEWSSAVVTDTPAYHASLAVADLNNDNYLDVVSTYYSTFYVFLNNGTPWEEWDEPYEFPPITDSSLDTEITKLKVADIDGDSRNDVITIIDNEIFVWRNTDSTGIQYTKGLPQSKVNFYIV